jgi:hypothetical protein
LKNKIFRPNTVISPLQTSEIMRVKLKTKKHIIYGMIMLIWSAVVFAGCAQNKLPDSFDEETVKAEAMKSIDYFNQRDYQSILDMGSDELKDSITAEEFAKASDPYLDKCGEYQEISKTVVVGSTDKKTGKEYGGVVMIGKYADGKIQFTIAFDEDMKLVQFLIK